MTKIILYGKYKHKATPQTSSTETSAFGLRAAHAYAWPHGARSAPLRACDSDSHTLTRKLKCDGEGRMTDAPHVNNTHAITRLTHTHTHNAGRLPVYQSGNKKG